MNTHFFAGEFFSGEFFFGVTPPTPTPGRDGLGGDDVPRHPHVGWSRERWLKLRKAPDDALESELRRVYAELTGEDAPLSVLSQVDAIVRPFAEEGDGLEVDWSALSAKYEITERLMRLFDDERALRAAMEDEDDILMLMQ